MIYIWILISIFLVIILTSKYKLNSFVALMLASLFLGVVSLAPSEIVGTLKSGFGLTLSSIGLIIIFGTMIGVNLHHSGAAYGISNFILSKTGNKRARMAIAIVGFLTGIPIFCDSGFIILSGISQSFSKYAKVFKPAMAATLGVSLYSVHCLIPPHPGATAAAGIMGADISYMIIFGLLIAIPAGIISFFFIGFLSRSISAQVEQEKYEATEAVNENLPPVVLSFLPIIIPLLLISFSSGLSFLPESGGNHIFEIFMFIGDPVMALFIGAAFSFVLIRDRSKNHLNELFSDAVNKAGPILIITAAGGMFGAIIKSTGAGESAGQFLALSGLGLLIPFMISSILKTAQGSTTVAIITAASLVSPMLAGLGLDSENGRILATLSMGAGSMMVSHANDSYFWVITRFSNQEPSLTLKYYSTSTIVMALSSLALIYLLKMVLL